MLQELWELIQPNILELIGTILLGIVSFISAKIKSCYEKKVKNEEIKSIVEDVVKYTEQKFNNLTSSEKFDKALIKASEWLNEKNIKVSETELEILIESTVNSLFGKEVK